MQESANRRRGTKTGPEGGSKGGSKGRTSVQTLPQHKFEPPYSELLSLGSRDARELYDRIANTLSRADAQQAASRLVEMALDESFKEYDGEENWGLERCDPRVSTPVHALRVLQRMGDAARVGIEPLLDLLGDENDALREETPFYYAAVGEPAVAPLAELLADYDEDETYRSVAAESLVEIAEKHPGLRPRIVALLDQAVLLESQDESVAGMLISGLLDLGSVESLPIIEAAFEENRVDESIVCLADVQEHFGLPVIAPRPQWNFNEEDLPETVDETEEEGEVRVPYVAAEKIGRNDPCSCGSGKKYKKCCGAAA